MTPHSTASAHRSRRSAARALGVGLALVLASASAAQQEDLEDVFGGFGTTTREEVAGPREGEGAIVGQVLDSQSGAPIGNATVILIWPDPGDGSEPRQDVQVTAGDGSYEFPSVPPGRYTLSFIKAGYRTSNMTGFEVAAGRENRADFPMPPMPSAEGGEILELEAFVATAETVGELMIALELRMESDQLLNVMSAEDLSRYAASDVADALKRVAGVNVVEGQFAIIRGLEDRYSSTLYNGAPVPSPDPDRQSIPLDLFPSEVVSNLVVAKTFGPELPSNSSGGSVDIVTSGYPETLFDVKLAAKTGLNQYAYDRFLELESGSPIAAREIDGADVLERELEGALGGRAELAGREVRYKAVASWRADFETEEGFQESRSPSFLRGDLSFGRLGLTSGRFEHVASEYEEQLTLYGGLGLDLDRAGRHRVDASAFWTRKDQEQVVLRRNGYLPGFDYRVIAEATENFEGIDANQFFGDTANVPGRNAAFDAWIVNAIGAREDPSDFPTRGAVWFASFAQSSSFDTRRDLRVYQLNGDHDADALLEGLHVAWAANYATTSQDETALGARFFYEPCGISGAPALRCPDGVAPIERSEIPASFPITVGALGPGKYLVNKGLFASFNAIDEEQVFGRLDVDYERGIVRWLQAELRSGLWYEHASRDVDASFLDPNRLNVGAASRCTAEGGCLGSGTQFAFFGAAPQDLGRAVFGPSSPLRAPSDGSLTALDFTQSEATREIQAWSAGAKATLREQLDVLGGLRLERIVIESKNDPFASGFALDGSPRIFPSKYLLFDRMDNVSRREVLRTPPYNDQILGIAVPVGPCRDPAGDPIPGGGSCVDLIDRAEIERLVNGEIDETRVLPSAGLAYRPFDWMTVRAAYSQTVARPSFREIGYYVSAKPGTDDLSIGNPQLQLSDVESWDARAELTWGDGDLAALSAFYKTVEDPVEQIIVRDPAVFDTSSLALYRTFFNNPNAARLQGIEVEARKNLGFLSLDFLGLELPLLGFARHFSLGANFSYIDAEVKRSEAELARSQRFFGDAAGPVPPGLERRRRLYNQPEWIANADLSFDHPDWGTRATLAFFAISDVLDAAGGATAFELTGQGRPLAFTLDRYVDSFHQLDLVVSQELWKGLAVRFGVKNLTDSKRAIVYDPEQTARRIAEREFRVGRDYSLQLSWSFSGPAR